MEKKYWTGRKRAAMARGATPAEARLIRYDLAGRYCVNAAAGLPFMLPDKGPASPGERNALRLPLPGAPRPDAGFRRPPRPRDEPENPAGGGR